MWILCNALNYFVEFNCTEWHLTIPNIPNISNISNIPNIPNIPNIAI
jgi:hypothetical protein